GDELLGEGARGGDVAVAEPRVGVGVAHSDGMQELCVALRCFRTHCDLAVTNRFPRSHSAPHGMAKPSTPLCSPLPDHCASISSSLGLPPTGASGGGCRGAGESGRRGGGAGGGL